MFHEFYKASEYLSLATLTSIFFGIFFVGVLAWVVAHGKDTYEHASRLPLDDDDPRVK